MKKKVVRTFEIPRHIYEELEKLKEKKGVTITALVNLAAAEFIRKEKD